MVVGCYTRTTLTSALSFDIAWAAVAEAAPRLFCKDFAVDPSSFILSAEAAAVVAVASTLSSSRWIWSREKRTMIATW